MPHVPFQHGPFSPGPIGPRSTRLPDAPRLSRAELAGELVDVTRELSRCYEELSMLYRVSTQMTVNQPLDRHVMRVCVELRRVLGIGWVAMLMDPHNGPGQLQEAFFIEGDPGMAVEVCHAAMARLQEHWEHDAPPRILDRAALVELDPGSELPAALREQPLLVVPVRHDGVMLGLLAAGACPGGEVPTSSHLQLSTSMVASLAVFLRNAQLYDESRELFLGSLHALVAAIDAKDAYTHGHSKRVALVSRMIASVAGLTPELQERAYLSGLVHDVGKIGIPESVLAKPGRLTAEEYEQIKLHPQIGARILQDVRQMAPLIPGVLHHHERWDGKGYPHGLTADEAPLLARVIGLADAFDAMSSDRTYRRRYSADQVREEIRINAGVQFDPQLAEAFLEVDTEPHRRMLKHQIKTEARPLLQRSA